MGMMVVVRRISARGSTQFEEIYRNRGARASLLQILLKALHSHIFALRSCLRLKSVCVRVCARVVDVAGEHALSRVINQCINRTFLFG